MVLPPHAQTMHPPSPHSTLGSINKKNCLNWPPLVLLDSLFTDVYIDWSKSVGARDAPERWWIEARLCSFSIWRHFIFKVIFHESPQETPLLCTVFWFSLSVENLKIFYHLYMLPNEMNYGQYDKEFKSQYYFQDIMSCTKLASIFISGCASNTDWENMHKKCNTGIYKSERLLASKRFHSQTLSYYDSKLRWRNIDFSFQTTNIKIKFM